jgi:hypothetical protein
MPAGPVGSVWQDDSWPDTVWEEGAWGAAQDGSTPPDVPDTRTWTAPPRTTQWTAPVRDTTWEDQ